MEKKILIILLIILIVLCLAYVYRRMSVSPSEEEVRSSCYAQALEKAREKFKEENPRDREGDSYFMEDYNLFYGQCLMEEGYY